MEISVPHKPGLDVERGGIVGWRESYGRWWYESTTRTATRPRIRYSVLPVAAAIQVLLNVHVADASRTRGNGL